MGFGKIDFIFSLFDEGKEGDRFITSTENFVFYLSCKKYLFMCNILLDGVVFVAVDEACENTRLAKKGGRYFWWISASLRYARLLGYGYSVFAWNAFEVLQRFKI